jgi:hypothetical protein
MPRKPKPPSDDPEQSKRFIDMAREIGADASKEEFERAFKKVSRPLKGPKSAISSSRSEGDKSDD